MLAIIILLFPAIVMVMWYHRLSRDSIDYKKGCVEFVGALLLINCILMTASYIIAGCTSSVINNFSSHIGYAWKYLICSLILAFGIPWICIDICKHVAPENSSLPINKNNCCEDNIHLGGRNKIFIWISGQWNENGGFSCIIPFLTAIACVICAIFFFFWNNRH